MRQRFGRSPSKGDDRCSPFRPNFLQFHGLRPPAGDDDQVDSIRKDARREAKALSTEAFDAVSGHRPADLAAHDEPDAGPLFPGLRGDEQHKVSRDDPARIRLDAPEIGLPTQPPSTIEGRAQGYFL